MRAGHYVERDGSVWNRLAIEQQRRHPGIQAVVHQTGLARQQRADTLGTDEQRDRRAAVRWCCSGRRGMDDPTRRQGNPPRGLHTLSHVRYTPHHEWFDEERGGYRDPYAYFQRVPKISNFPHMVQDAQRYLPVIRECRYDSSIWGVKTVLPLSEVDDSRPILVQQAEGAPNLTSIMGSKIDNVYDMLDTISPIPTPCAAP